MISGRTNESPVNFNVKVNNLFFSINEVRALT